MPVRDARSCLVGLDGQRFGLRKNAVQGGGRKNLLPRIWTTNTHGPDAQLPTYPTSPEATIRLRGAYFEKDHRLAKPGRARREAAEPTPTRAIECPTAAGPLRGPPPQLRRTSEAEQRSALAKRLRLFETCWKGRCSMPSSRAANENARSSRHGRRSLLETPEEYAALMNRSCQAAALPLRFRPYPAAPSATNAAPNIGAEAGRGTVLSEAVPE
jgi:hypothetical protein